MQAANLVMDAERAIAKANPPMSKAESGAIGGKNKHVISDNVLIEDTTEIPVVKPESLRQMRQAHGSITSIFSFTQV